MRRVSIALAALLTSLYAAPAEARNDEQGRPFARGTILPYVGLGAGWSPDLVTLGWSVGAGYFVAHGLELGMTFGGTHLLWSRAIREELPGLPERIPNHLFELTPRLRYVFYRSRYFSPYVFAGTGPTFLTDNPSQVVIAHWVAGPGVAIGLGEHMFVTVSVSFSGRYPWGACERAFTDTFETAEGTVEFSLQGMCRFRWSPGIGIGGMF